MRLDLSTTIAQKGLLDNCILEYFGTLYEISSHFCCTGEQILRHNGFRNRAWVESLFELAAKHHCFANANCPEGLPFRVIRPLITQEIVAHFCLAGDILETAFYEYLLQQQYQKLSSMIHTKLIDQTLREIRMARRKFCKRKAGYISLAYGRDLSRRFTHTFDVCTVCKDDALQQDIIFALELMPTVLQHYSRGENFTDMAPVKKLCRKYAHLFTICAEFEDSFSS